MESEIRKIRIGEAAAAINATAKSVSHWFSRYSGRGVKPAAPQTGTWLEFSFGDVAALALTRYFVELLGWSAPTSFPAAMIIVKARWPGLFDEQDPHWSRTIDTDNLMAFGSRSGDLFEFGNLEGNDTSEDVKSLVESMSKMGREPRVTVSIMAGPIIQDAFEALAEMGHQTPRLINAEQPSGKADHSENPAAT